MRGSDNILITDLSIAASVIGITEEDLTAALTGGKTIADVAAEHRADVHRVVVALVSDAVADVAADVRRGELTAGHVRWLVALATMRAEEQVITKFPPIGLRRRAGALQA